MTWFMAGAAAISVGTSLYSANSAAKSSARNASQASKAEGEAIVKERLNKTISNSYNTAFAQMQLALRKRQLSQQGADISAATLAAKGAASAESASTGSIGSSVDVVVSDIMQKSDAATQSTQDALENAVTNYNNELDMLVINTDQSTPNVRKYEYNGPSGGEMLGTAILGGLTQFASSYAMRRMNLGLGQAANVPSSAGSSIYSLPTQGVKLGGSF